MTTEGRNTSLAPTERYAGVGSPREVSEQKTVKKASVKLPSNVVAAVRAKQFAISKRSILSNRYSLSNQANDRGNTLLDQPVSGELFLKPWKETRDEFIKLAAAAVPLYWMAKYKGWELKNFTLILSEKLSGRLDEGDATASKYLRDEMSRRVRASLGGGAEFLYGLEKAPVALSDGSSRRRWHLHGLIIGPVGFAARGRETPLRRALKSLKGEADSDLMFQTPGEKLGLGLRSSAIRWSFYAVKNGLTLELNPSLADVYDMPPGKQTHISAQLRREAHRWHDGSIAGLTAPQLVAAGPQSFYGFR